MYFFGYFLFRRQAKKKSTFYKRISDYDDLDKMKVRFLSFYEYEVFNTVLRH